MRQRTKLYFDTRDFASGSVPGHVSAMEKRKKRRVSGGPNKRAAECVQFALDLTYKSIDNFVSTRVPRSEDGEWRPSKSQMSRDMNKIFGYGWPVRRGTGGRSVAGRKSTAAYVSGLEVSGNAHYLLEPNRTLTVLSSLSEHKIPNMLEDFERSSVEVLLRRFLYHQLLNLRFSVNFRSLKMGPM